MDELMKCRVALQEALDERLCGWIAVFWPVRPGAWAVTIYNELVPCFAVKIPRPLPGQSVESWVESACRSVLPVWVDVAKNAVRALEVDGA